MVQNVFTLEAESWKLEAGKWKLKTGSWKLEAGNWKHRQFFYRKLPQFIFSIPSSISTIWIQPPSCFHRVRVSLHLQPVLLSQTSVHAVNWRAWAIRRRRRILKLHMQLRGGRQKALSEALMPTYCSANKRCFIVKDIHERKGDCRWAGVLPELSHVCDVFNRKSASHKSLI